MADFTLFQFCFHDSASLLLPCLLPTSNNLKSMPSQGMPASQQ
jgi:hypothetical protein